jgi:CIC family chloride channel protein
MGSDALLPSDIAPSGAYALVGMAAFLAGAVHCPITAFLLLFEITGDYHLILPLMLSCSVSTLVAKLLREESIYTMQLLRRGIDIRRREENLMQSFTVGQVMRREAPTLSEQAPFDEIVQHFLISELPVCFVINVNQQLLGEISMHDVKELLREDSLGPLVIAKDLAYSSFSVTHPEETLARCLEKFTSTDQEHLPVTSQETGRLQGIISHRDVLDLYNREILRHEYVGLSLRSERIVMTVHERVRLPHAYTVEVVQVPFRYVGRTLRETQLRTQFNLTAVAIRHSSFNGQDELPEPDRPFERFDHLVLVGRPEDLRRFLGEKEAEALI